MRRFIVVVDTQADFMRPDGALAVDGAEKLIGPMQEWLKALNPADTAGVLFTFDTHLVETFPRSAEAEQFPIHCVRDTPGWQNVLDADAIAPGIPTYRIEKGVFDMWAEPDLVIEAIGSGQTTPRNAFFAELKARGIEQVTVIGVAADYCVRWAIDGLVARGFSVEVPPNLTRGIARQVEEVVAAEFAGAPVRLATNG